MDYNNGKELHKYQWDLVQDPQGMWFTGLIDEEEGAYYSNKKVKKALEKLRYGYIKDKSIKFIGNIRNIHYAEDIKLLNGKVYKEIVIAPNQTGTIKINPKDFRESGRIINEIDNTTGKKCISFYKNMNRIFKILYVAETKNKENSFLNYIFPEVDVWKKQLYSIKKTKTQDILDIEEGYKIQVEENSGKTAIYKTIYKYENESKDADKIKVYEKIYSF